MPNFLIFILELYSIVIQIFPQYAWTGLATSIVSLLMTSLKQKMPGAVRFLSGAIAVVCLAFVVSHYAGTGKGVDPIKTSPPDDADIVTLTPSSGGVSSAGRRGVAISPVDKLSFRSGPSTDYVDMFTLPQSTSVVAFETEWGNEIEWVLVEFYLNGKYQRAYTGLWRFAEGTALPAAEHEYIKMTVRAKATVYAGPGTEYAARGTARKGASVTLLRYEGDGYAFIEYHEGSTLSRGWISSADLD